MTKPIKAKIPCSNNYHRWRPALRADGRYRDVCTWCRYTSEEVKAYQKEHPEYGAPTEVKKN